MGLTDEVKFKYFTWEEILRPLKKQNITFDNIPIQLRANIIPTMRVLDLLREDYGKPIIINSTYRTAEYNNKINGTYNSLHLSFNAIDFTVVNKEDLISIYNTLNIWDRTSNKFSFLPKPTGNFGIGIYKDFLHLDTRSILGRKSPERWVKNG